MSFLRKYFSKTIFDNFKKEEENVFLFEKSMSETEKPTYCARAGEKCDRTLEDGTCVVTAQCEMSQDGWGEQLYHLFNRVTEARMLVPIEEVIQYEHLSSDKLKIKKQQRKDEGCSICLLGMKDMYEIFLKQTS